jgi:hypothetical protein
MDNFRILILNFFEKDNMHIIIMLKLPFLIALKKHLCLPITILILSNVIYFKSKNAPI